MDNLTNKMKEPLTEEMDERLECNSVSGKKFFNTKEIWRPFKCILIVGLTIVVLGLLGGVAFITTCVVEKSKYQRIITQMTGYTTGEKGTPPLGSSEPIIVQGKAVPPESFVFKIKVVLAYDEKDKSAENAVLLQRPMFQEQIRTYLSKNLVNMPTENKEEEIKEGLRKWLNTLLNADHIQQIYFLEYDIAN